MMLPVTNRQPRPLGSGSSRRCFDRARKPVRLSNQSRMVSGLYGAAVAVDARGDLGERLGRRTVLHRTIPVVDAAVARTLEHLRLLVPGNEAAEVRARGVERGDVRLARFDEENRPPLESL